MSEVRSNTEMIIFRFITLSFAMSVWFYSSALACTPIPDYMITNPSELIRPSNTIFIARVTAARLKVKKVEVDKSKIASSEVENVLDDLRFPGGKRQRKYVRYEFSIIKFLKGSGPKRLSQEFEEPFLPQFTSDFRLHRDSKFWRNIGGRTQIERDCSIRPSFEVGDKYLIFYGQKPHVKGYEKIENGRDKWLKFVERAVQQQ